MVIRTSHRFAGALAAALAVALLPAAPAVATSEDDVAELEQELSESEQRLEEVGNDLQAVGEQVSAAEQELDQVNVQLEATESQVAAQQVVVDEMSQLVSAGVRDIAMGRGGDLERAVAFTEPDLERALNGIVLLDHVLRSQGATYGEYLEELDRLDELQETTAALRAEAEVKLEEANQLRAEAEAEYAEVEALVAANSGELEEAQAVMAAARAAQQDQASRDGDRGGSGGSVEPASAPGPAPDWGGGAINCGGVSVTPPNATAATAISWACSRLGMPYCWGGTGPSCYDCSGFTQAAYAQAGVALPRTAAAQGGAGATVSRSNLIPGDLVVTNNSGHIGMYVGNNAMIHSPHTGDVVKVSPLSYFGFVTASRPS